jgi:hypothetical protein
MSGASFLGKALFSSKGADVVLVVAFEVRANAVWRCGRLFLRCPCSGHRATRIYLPTANSWPACRCCCGLTYESRQHANYKDAGPRWLGGLSTHRDMAYCQTDGERERRREASVKRWAERKALR